MATELHSSINVDLGWTWRYLFGAFAVVDSNRLQFALAMGMFDDVITTRFGTVKAIMIVNKNTEGEGSLLVGGAGTQEWCAPFGMIGDTVRVMPGSPLMLASMRDGWRIEAGAEALKISAVGGDVTFDVAILGLDDDDRDWDSSSYPSGDEEP